MSKSEDPTDFSDLPDETQPTLELMKQSTHNFGSNKILLVNSPGQQDITQRFLDAINSTEGFKKYNVEIITPEQVRLNRSPNLAKLAKEAELSLNKFFIDDPLFVQYDLPKFPMLPTQTNSNWPPYLADDETTDACLDDRKIHLNGPSKPKCHTPNKRPSGLLAKLFDNAGLDKPFHSPFGFTLPSKKDRK